MLTTNFRDARYPEEMQMKNSEYREISWNDAENLAQTVLASAGFTAPHIEVMARNMLDAQAQECHSHGLYRLISCYKAARAGGVDPAALPEITDVAPAIVRADAKGGCSLLAFSRAADLLVSKADTAGIAALAISRCYHYSALWWEVEHLARRGVVAMAMTPTHPYVAPFGGLSPLLGTNPLAFSWPRQGDEPYTFDFATSAAARGEVELRARAGESLPPNWAIDAAGEQTTDADAALGGALLTFGGHKGSAISTMIELLAGPLIGDLTSHRTAPAGSGSTLGAVHGELVLAFSPTLFGADHAGAEALFDKILGTGARLPSQRRRAAGGRSAGGTLRVEAGLLKELEQMACHP